jgi:GTPase
MFVDRVKIKIRAGNGGDGCTSFRREKFIPRGGPDGGNGGNGGSVYFIASAEEQSLTPLRYMNHYEAEHGVRGQGKKCHGKNGEDLYVKIPVGTMISNAESGDVLADLNEPDMTYLAARGGMGGKGNINYGTSTNQAPRKFTKGTLAEEAFLKLELKLIADVGLVGYPNAGKSTFLSVVTNANPEVASYPFTTLRPHIGTVEFPDYFRFTIADIPGLVDGAHDNVGLGMEFLRHIERTTVIAYVLDMAGTDNRLPWDDLKSLLHELECYQEGLTGRQSIIIANKMDEEIASENLEILRTHTNLPIFPISALLEDQLDALLLHLRKLMEIAGRTAY